VWGSDSIIALGAARFMLPEDYIALVDKWEPDPVPPRPRLLVKGFPLNHAGLHHSIEKAGGNVVAEDDWWGSRAAENSIVTSGDPLKAIFEHYYLEVPSPRVDPPSAREQWFEHALDSARIDGVVFYIPPYDDLSGWAVPANRALLDSRRIPSIVVRHDAGSPAARAAIATQVAELLRPFGALARGVDLG
jgi:benzoyl-CoA reductase/2-hydroxyglutaryl-CoA dehydratase subunit BcrC/BadD/HgdB